LLAAVHRDLLKMADKDITIDRQAVESLTTDLNGTYLDKLAALENCGVHITVGQVIKIQDEIAEWIREVLLGLLKTTFHEQHISRDDTIAPCSGTSILVDPNQTQSTNVDDSADAVDDTTMEDATAVEDTTTEDATAAEQTNDVDKSTVFDASATAGPSTDKPATNPVSSLRIDTEDWSKICNAPYLLYSEGKTKACKECNIILPAYKFFYSHADFWELSCQDKCPKCAASCTEYGMAEFAFRFMHHQDGLFGWYGLMDDATLEPDATARKRHKQQYDREYSKRFKKWKRYHYWKTVDEEQRKVYDNEEGKKEEKSTGTLRPSDLAANDHSKGKRKATK
jgi:hypothetical protein